MNPLIEAMVIAGAVSVAVSAIVLSCLPSSESARYTGALGVAAGFLSAYAYLEPGHLTPASHWQWLPWLAMIASIVGPISLATGVKLPERWALSVILALTAAWFLVPTRASLEPMRTTYLLAVAAGMTLLWNLMDRPAQSQSGVPLALALAATSLSGAALVAFAVSIRIGFLGAVGAAALAGGGLSAAWKRDSTFVRGMLAPASVILIGVLLTAQLNGLPISTIALILSAPVTLWLFEAGPLARLQGLQSQLVKTIVVAVPHIAAWCLSLSNRQS